MLYCRKNYLLTYISPLINWYVIYIILKSFPENFKNSEVLNNYGIGKYNHIGKACKSNDGGIKS